MAQDKRKVDGLAGKGSIAGKVKENRERQKSQLDRIMNEIDSGTARKQIR